VKFDKMPADVRRFEDGTPMLVVRPDKPEQTALLAEIAVRHQNDEALRAAGEGCVTFIGFLVHRGGKFTVVDEDGDNPVDLQRGDLILSPEELHQPN
jgi:hypothetical protein